MRARLLQGMLVLVGVATAAVGQAVAAAAAAAEGVTFQVDQLEDVANGTCTNRTTSGGSSNSTCSIRAGLEQCMSLSADATPLCTLNLTSGVHNVTRGQVSLQGAAVPIRIVGRGMFLTVVSGLQNDARRWLWIDGDGSPDWWLSVESLRVQLFGVRSRLVIGDGDGGGAIYATRTHNLTLSRVSFGNNSAMLGLGGALALDGSNTDVNVSGCEFEHNLGDEGGALGVASTGNERVSLHNNWWFANRALRHGGAVFVEEETAHVNVVGDNFTDNFAGLFGAGVYFGRAVNNARFHNAWFQSNHAVTNGAAVLMEQDCLHTLFEAVTFVRNRAGYGPAVRIGNRNNDTIFRSCVFEHNEAAQLGGAVYAHAGNDRMLFDRCQWTANKAQYNGGAVYFLKDNAFSEFRANLFRENVATSSSGGGIFWNGGNTHALVHQNCTFDRNEASEAGGAILVRGRNHFFAVRDSVFSENQANEGGAAFFYSDNRYATLSHTQWSSNRADEGGAVGMNGSNVHAVFTNNSFHKNDASSAGGAVRFGEDNRNVTFQGGRFSANTAATGGAISGSNGNHNLTLTGGIVFVRNVATSRGGAMLLDTGNNAVRVQDCTFSGNQAEAGGAVAVVSRNNESRWENCTWEENVASSEGGAMWFGSVNFFANVTSCLFVRNTATVDGGAVLLDTHNSFATIADTEFLYNDAANHGGGLYVHDNNAHVRVMDSYFHGCTADYGGAISLYTRNDYFSLADTIVRFCNAQIDGGGVNVFEFNNFFAIHSCTIYNNSALNGNGGSLLLYYSNNNATVADTVLSYSTASDDGGCFYSYDEQVGLVVLDSRFLGCTAASDGGGAYVVQNHRSTRFVNCTWAACAAINGGGLFLGTENRITTVSASRFVQCRSADSGAGTYVFQNNERLLMQGVVWQFNTAQGSGAAIYLNEANNQFALSRATLDSNLALTNGGGVYVYKDHQELEITDTTLRGQVAGFGGGMYVSHQNSGIRISNTSFEENRCVSGSGLAVLQSNANILLERVRFTRNAALLAGAGMYIAEDNEDITLERCEGNYNVAAGDGAVLYSLTRSRSSAVLRSTFVNNTAFSGAAMNVGRNDEWLIMDCLMKNNSATSTGGAIQASKTSSLVLVGSTLEGNAARLGAGGAASFLGVDTLVVADSRLERNRAKNTDGGAFSLVHVSGGYVVNTTFKSNAVPRLGGAIVASTGTKLTLGGRLPRSVVESVNATVSASSLRVVSSQLFNQLQGVLNQDDLGQSFVDFEFNSAAFAGAVLVDSAAHLWVNGSVFFRNVANSGYDTAGLSGVGTGGALVVEQATAILHNVSMVENRAVDGLGGGAYVGGGAMLNMTSGYLGNGSATLGGAAYIDKAATAAHFQDISFVSNNASGYGGALYIETAACNLSGDSVVTGNRAVLGAGGGVYWDWGNTGGASPGLSAVYFERNEAVYGDDVATPVYAIRSPDSTVADSGSTAPAIVVSAVDFYNQTVTTYSGTFAQASVSPVPGTGCSNVTLAGSPNGDFVEGVAIFGGMILTCDPGSAVAVTFAAAAAVAGAAPSDVSLSVGTTTLTSVTDVDLSECHLGEYLDRDRLECVECGVGSYAWKTTWKRCKDCPSHATCPGGAVVNLNKGYWRSDNFSRNIRWCPAEDACLGGPDADSSAKQCKRGSSGPLCLICEPHYFQPSAFTSCKSCNHAARYVPLAIVCVLVVVVGGVFAYGRVKQPFWFQLIVRLWDSQIVRIQLKTIFGYMQLVSQLHFIFPVAYPTNYVSTASATSVTNLGFSNVLSPHCINSKYDFYDTLVISTVGTLLLALVLATITVARIVKARAHNDPARELEARSQGVALLLGLAYVVFPGTSTTIFQAFTCDDDFDDGASYLKADYSISCHSREYTSYLVYSSVMILVFPVGILLLYSRVLWLHREHINPSVESIVARAKEETLGGRRGARMAELLHRVKEAHAMIEQRREKLGQVPRDMLVYEQSCCRALRQESRSHDVRLLPFLFLVEAYTPSHWYFEVVETVRRLLLSGILVFLGPTTDLQIVEAMLICLAFGTLYSWLQPLAYAAANRLMFFTQACVFLQLFATLLISQETLKRSAALGAAMIFLLLAPVAMLLYDLSQRTLHGASSRTVWRQRRSKGGGTRGGAGADEAEDDPHQAAVEEAYLNSDGFNAGMPTNQVALSTYTTRIGEDSKSSGDPTPSTTMTTTAMDVTNPVVVAASDSNPSV